jgi:predicted  nucleic acid-binding Zn-ribbon protein
MNNINELAIKELTDRIEEIQSILKEVNDENEREKLIQEVLTAARKVNRYLRAIGADESEMYDL